MLANSTRSNNMRTDKELVEIALNRFANWLETGDDLMSLNDLKERGIQKQPHFGTDQMMIEADRLRALAQDIQFQ